LNKAELQKYPVKGCVEPAGAETYVIRASFLYIRRNACE
jgi:hypothetical protein